MIYSLQISCWVYQWNNFENRSIFGKDMDNSGVSCFLWTTVYLHSCWTLFLSQNAPDCWILHLKFQKISSSDTNPCSEKGTLCSHLQHGLWLCAGKQIPPVLGHTSPNKILVPWLSCSRVPLLIFSVLLNNSETWTISAALRRRIKAFEMGEWQGETGYKINKKRTGWFCDEENVAEIWLCYFGHITGMNSSRHPKQASDGKLCIWSIGREKKGCVEYNKTARCWTWQYQRRVEYSSCCCMPWHHQSSDDEDVAMVGYWYL